MFHSHSNSYQSLHKHTFKTQGKCDTCHKYKYPIKSEDNTVFRCLDCIKQGVKSSPPSLLDTVTSLLSLSSNNNDSTPIHCRREEIDRWRCVIYHLDGVKKKDIINRLRTTCLTINRWIRSYQSTRTMIEKKRLGRKRKLSEAQVIDIVEYTKKVKFTTPSLIKYHFSLNVSKATIDRRLIEHDLFGRVGTHTHTHTHTHTCI
jgi:transposase